jgi:hypothetical protein
MNKQPRKPGHNVVQIPAKPAAPAAPVADDGSPHDPRTREALRLVESFLAIEDAAARAALIALAERLVSYDWVRKVQQR